MLITTATSSCYFSDDGKFAYTAGGPGARINALAEDGGIGEEIQEMLYVPKESIDEVDKTRAAVVSLGSSNLYMATSLRRDKQN